MLRLFACRRRALATGTNYFRLLGVAQRFDVDADDLAARFKQLQRQWHPDLHAAGAAGSDPAKAAVTSALLNTAYGVLRDPQARAEHLLQLLGDEGAPDMDAAFLAWVVECRERIADIKGDDDAEQLGEELDKLHERCMDNLRQYFADGRVEEASEEAARLKYIHRMRVALDDATG